MQVIFTPYFLDKYIPGYNSFKKDGWIDNLYSGEYTDFETITTTLNKQIAEFVNSKVKENQLPVSVCGECLKSFGALKGLRDTGLNPALLWLDAHGDFNTHASTPSGFIGGMSLAILTGNEEPKLLIGLGLNPQPEEKTIIYDKRNLDSGEAVLLSESKIRQPNNIEELLMECNKEDSIFLHIDSDIINPIDAPAMLYRTEGGPRLTELISFIKKIKNKLAAVSIVMCEPTLDDDGKSSQAVSGLIKIFTEV